MSGFTALMKILHFTDSLRSGGKERQLVELLKGLSSREHIQCELATMSREIHYPEVFELDVKIHYLLWRGKRDLTIFFRFHRLCREIRPDVIQTWGSFPSVFTVPAAKLSGAKFVNGTIRKAPERLGFLGEDWVRSKLTFPFSDRIVANSFAGLKSYRAPAVKSLCVHNGFDFNRIRDLRAPGEVRRRFGVVTDKVVGMVATFSDLKDYETYFSAAESILARRNDVTFVAVGDGPDFERRKGSISPRFRQNIRLLGKQDNAESIINIFDIGVLATFTEGLSNSIMETMALGKPVVASENDGNAELVVHDETGFLVKQKDPGDMARAISRLLDDETLRLEMGARSRKRIEDKFSLEKMTRSYTDLYESLLEKS